MKDLRELFAECVDHLVEAVDDEDYVTARELSILCARLMEELDRVEALEREAAEVLNRKSSYYDDDEDEV